MNDTTPSMEVKLREMMMKKTGEQRFLMGCSMFTFARTLVRSSIMQKDEDISPGDLRRELFIRFYGTDFDEDSRNRIAHHFANSEL